MGIVGRQLRRLEDTPYTPWLLVVPPVLVGAVRAVEEAVRVTGFASISVVVHDITFYVGVLVLMAAVVGAASGRGARRVLGPVALGLGVGVLPPVVDLFLDGPPHAKYLYFREFHWDFAAPYELPGETVCLWVSVVLAGAYVAWTSRSWWRPLLALAGTWAAMQFLLYFWQVPIAWGVDLGDLPTRLLAFNLVAAVLAATAVAWWHRDTLGPSLARVNHALPFGMLAAAGARAAGQGWAAAAAKAIVMVLAFLAVIVVNDHVDRDQDAAAGGPARPATAGDAVLAWALQALLLACVAADFQQGLGPLVAFLAAWAAYHLPALRWKRWMMVAYNTEGLGAATSFLFGVAAWQKYPQDPWLATVAVLLIGGGAVVSVLKDDKDVEADRAAGVQTLYTVLTGRGVALRTARIGVGVAATACTLVPPIWLLGWGGADPVAAGVALGLAAAPAACLAAFRDRTRAVESALWALSLYFAAIAWAMPAVLGASPA